MSLATTEPIAERFQATGDDPPVSAAANPPAPLQAGSAADHDVAFQRLMRSFSIDDARRDQREAINGFHAFEAFAGRALNSDGVAQQVVQHPVFNATTNAAPSGQSARSPDITPQMLAALTIAPPSWKPTEKLDSARPAGNSQQNRQEGQQKGADAQAKMAEMRANLQSMIQNGAPQQNKVMPDRSQPVVGSLLGKVVRDLAISGVVSAVAGPGAGAAVTAAAVIRAWQGQGTIAGPQQGASAFDRPSTDRRGRPETAFVSTAPTGPAPAVISAPSPLPVWAKLNSDIGPRATLAGYALGGISKVALEDSPAMRTLNSQKLDAGQVEKIHLAMEKKGFENDKGQVAFAPEILPVVMKNPRLAAPALTA